MAQDYNEYLAINVLNEQQFVTYRALSRALKVHSNKAKQMLYEFHRKQNAKKPGSVHATYLLTGLRQTESIPQSNGVHSQDGEDTVMQSSPMLPSSSAAHHDDVAEETAPVRSVMLVKEEHLEQARGTFESISSIQIYSLEANGLSDVQALTDCNRKVGVDYASEDPLQAWKQYGTIQNSNVKRRTRRTVPPPPAPLPNAEAKMQPFATAAKSKEAEMKAESKDFSKVSTPEPEKKFMTKPVQNKRQNSDLFKSFAKGKTKAKEESRSSAEASPALKPVDQQMGDFSDDDLDDDASEVPQADVKDPSGKSKREREADLQAMMDQEDEIMEEAGAPIEDIEEGEAPVDHVDSPKEEEPKETVTVENGRRRGRRRVVVKKTVKDEEGYLVTKEEAAWESFSEDEPAPKKIKGSTGSSMLPGNKPTAKKGAKPGQGNIMTFFSKK